MLRSSTQWVFGDKMTRVGSEYSVDVSYKFYHKSGWYYEVVTDPDGNGMVTIRMFNDYKDEEPHSEMSIPPELVDGLCFAMRKVIENDKEFDNV